MQRQRSGGSMMRSSRVVRAIRLSLVLAVSSFSPALSADADRFSTPLAPPLCVRSLAYCAKNFAATRHTEYWNICLLASNLCRASRSGDWRAFQIARFTWWNTKFFFEYDKKYAMREGVNVYSVGQLLKMCQGDMDWQKDACREYVVDWSEVAVQNGRRRGKKIASVRAACPDGPISDADYIKNFVEWAEKHPSQKDTDVTEGVAAAAATEWPCP